LQGFYSKQETRFYFLFTVEIEPTAMIEMKSEAKSEMGRDEGCTEVRLHVGFRSQRPAHLMSFPRCATAAAQGATARTKHTPTKEGTMTLKVATPFFPILWLTMEASVA